MAQSGIITGTGLDLVEVARVKKALARKGFLAKNFSENEKIRCSGVPERYYAVLFALKEAYLKSLGQGMFTLPLREISFHLSNGTAWAEHDKAAIAAYACDRRFAMASVIRRRTPTA